MTCTIYILAPIHDIAETAKSKQLKTYEYLIGREIGERFPKRDVKIGEEVLKVEGLSSGKYFQNVSFSVRAGEVLGVAGLMGAGRTEIMQSIVKRGIEKFRIKCFGPWHECYGKHAAGQWGYPGCFCGQ